MPSLPVTDYGGRALPNLVAELEMRLTGSTAGTRFAPDLRQVIPDASTYVLVLFDGLGSRQLEHDAARSLAASVVATIDAPFPTTTTVSLASVATALPPSQHGLLGYQLWLPEVGQVVNTIKWTTLWGEPVDYDTERLLPSPNLWERLTNAGLEPITVQPANFEGTALSRALYRGCRYEAAPTVDELIAATLQLASVPGRLVFTYLPHVDFAAHVYGLSAPEYAKAVTTVANAWDRLARAAPSGASLIGTADHGLVDMPSPRQTKLAKAVHADRTFYGDGRAMFVRGEGQSLAASLPATWVPFQEAQGWWGPRPLHERFSERAPDGILVADENRLLLHRHSDDRMVGHHGGLTDAERLIPVLVA